MILSLSLIILLGLSMNAILLKFKIPSLIAYMITGLILGPYVLDLLDPSLMNISSELRKIALIVILLRAGLTLDLKDLKSVGRGAILLSFLPATLEIVAIAFLSYFFLEISLIEGLILGSVVAAVSPAVVVPRMINLIEKKIGTEKSIPQMVLAGTSLDDIYAVVMFTLFVQIYQTDTVNMLSFLTFPISLITGSFSGFVLGYLLTRLFKRYHMRDTIKVLIIFGVAFLFDFIENAISKTIPFSSLIGIMALGLTILKFYPILAQRLTQKFSKIWVFSEMILFVMIGAIVNITIITDVGIDFVVILLLAMIVRFGAVIISTAKQNLLFKERLFVFFAYLPKATVQAAIGAIPLALGIPSGEIILVISVLAIFVTAPLGAILIDQTHNRLIS